MINKYNTLIDKIVFEYIKRLYKEEKLGEEPEKLDYRIMNHNLVNEGPVVLWDRYLPIEKLLICEANKLPAISLLDFYDYELDRNEKGLERITNYYNWVKTNPKFK